MGRRGRGKVNDEGVVLRGEEMATFARMVGGMMGMASVTKTTSPIVGTEELKRALRGRRGSRTLGGGRRERDGGKGKV